jgi:hypothetical protein
MPPETGLYAFAAGSLVFAAFGGGPILNRGTKTIVQYPSLCPAAGENQRIDFFVFDHAELQIAIEWCGRNRLPIEHGVPFMQGESRLRVEVGQNQPAQPASAAPAFRHQAADA